VRSTLQFPLATPKADLEKIIRKGKVPQEGTSTTETCFFYVFHGPSLETPISSSHLPVIQSVGVSRTLNFGSVPIEFFPPGLGLEGEILVTPLSHEIVSWFRPSTSKYFPNLGFTTAPPIMTAVVQREPPTPSRPVTFYSNPLLFPFPPRSLVPISPVRTPYPPNSPPPIIPMVGSNPPRSIMDTIVASRYAPLVLPHPLNSIPIGGYLKQLPNFTGEGYITIEDNLATFYSYADNYVIVDKDVWMRIVFHSLDGEARKWFRALSPGSITRIEDLYDVFLRQWGDKKDFMYYITEFGSLKRKEGESIYDFSKRFNNMYNKIPAKIKPTEASAKITYASSSDPNFYLLLRERRSTSLAHMQDATLEVESNILAVDQLRNKTDRDRVRGRNEASTSSFSAPLPQMDEVTKLLKSLSARMERLELVGKRTYKNPQNIDNKGNFRRANNNAPQIMPREQRDRDINDQKIQTPLPKKISIEEEREEEELEHDPEIHCVGDTSLFPHLTQSAYEESLMNSQINEPNKWEKVNNSTSKYNLRSKKKEGKSDIPDPSPRAKNPAKDATDSGK